MTLGNSSRLALGAAGIAGLGAVTCLAIVLFEPSAVNAPPIPNPSVAGIDAGPGPQPIQAGEDGRPGDRVTPPSVRPPDPAPLSRPAPVKPGRGDWASIAPLSLRSWPSLATAIEAARPRLAPCYAEETQARFGAHGYTTTGPTATATGAPVLLVELEVAAPGRARVVDAPVESRGAAEDGLLSCAQEALRGMELPGPGAVGDRFRIRVPLGPMVPDAPVTVQRAPRVRLKKP